MYVQNAVLPNAISLPHSIHSHEGWILFLDVQLVHVQTLTKSEEVFIVIECTHCGPG